MRRRTLLLSAATSGYALLQWLGRSYGTTRAERRRALPGDELCARPHGVTTHAVTIAAPPRAVWPWLVQMGWGRGQWYTARWVDRLLFQTNGPSADHIVPEWQGLAVGDRILDGPPELHCAFVVEQLDPNRALVLRSREHLPPGWAERFGAELDWTWSFVLDDLGDGRTRFILRSRLRLRPWWATAAYLGVLIPADFIMARQMLRGLRSRAERAWALVDRVSAEDLVSLATDVGAAPMQVGAVLRLDAGGGFDVAEATRTIGDRIRAVPRLRQRLVEVPPGCGRPVWVDDPDFRVGDHVEEVACPAPGDEDALLGMAAAVVTARLPADRPLWRVTFVTGLSGGGAGMVVAFHHVLADGIGGLAVLASLVDGAAAPPASEFPRPAPSRRALALDAVRTRFAAVAGTPRALRQLREAGAELLPATRGRAAPCSLNRPTGARRRLAAVRADLEAVHHTARCHGATVNDVVLTAVAGALSRLLHARGEAVDRFVISVPASARQQASATDLGNHVGVMPVELPGGGDPLERLREVALRTRAGKATPPDASTALLGPAFRVLARVGLFQRFVDHQRLVHTFATNLRGPASPLSFRGATIEDVLAVAVITGNVTVSFAVLSYASTLAITVIADPEACPDVGVLRALLQEELDGLAAADPRFEDPRSDGQEQRGLLGPEPTVGAHTRQERPRP